MPRSPVLELLWEPGDPAVVLAERFGHADAGAAARWVAAVLSEHWDVETRACDRIVMSHTNALAWVTTGDRRLLLKWSVDPDRFDRLEQVGLLTSWLDARGQPVSAPLPAHDGRRQVACGGVAAALQRVVEGDLLDVGDAAQVHGAGAALARLHLTLADHPHADRLPSPTGATTSADRITRWLGTAGDQVPATVTAALRDLVTAAPPEPVHQLLHGDVRSANLLWNGTRLAAFLDLEEVRRGPCVDEVARAAVLLGTRFRGWGPVPPDVRARFRAGYESVRPFTPREAAWWPVLELWHSWAMVPPAGDPTGWAAAASLVPLQASSDSSRR